MTTSKGGTSRRRPVGRSAPSAQELLAESKRVGADLADVAGAALHAARGWEMLLRDQLDRQPIATLAVAAGLGYLLGGGLRSGLARTLAGMGARLAAERVMGQLIAPNAGER